MFGTRYVYMYAPHEDKTHIKEHVVPQYHYHIYHDDVTRKRTAFISFVIL